jgi:hypothetical protein
VLLESDAGQVRRYGENSLMRHGKGHSVGALRLRANERLSKYIFGGASLRVTGWKNIDKLQDTAEGGCATQAFQSKYSRDGSS